MSFLIQFHISFRPDSEFSYHLHMQFSTLVIIQFEMSLPLHYTSHFVSIYMKAIKIQKTNTSSFFSFSPLFPSSPFPLISSLIPLSQKTRFSWRIQSAALFYTVLGVLTASSLEWFAIPSSRGSCFVRTLHYYPSVLGSPAWHGS